MNKVVKWISNYWYHYKLRTILCLFFAVVVGVSVFEFATRESYDMKVYLYMSEFVSSEVETSLEETLEGYYSEQGLEKNIQVINLSYDPYKADGEQKMSYASALAGELRLKENFLILTDEYRFNELDKNQTFNNVFEENELFDRFDNKAYSLKSTEFEKTFQIRISKNGGAGKRMPELFISLLSAPENNSKNYENYKQASRLVNYIIKKEK